MLKSGCEARQYGDEYHCAHCGLVWDVKDPDPPECSPKTKTITPASPEYAREQLAKIRKMLED